MILRLLAMLLVATALAACGVDSTPQGSGTAASADNASKGEKKAQ